MSVPSEIMDLVNRFREHYESYRSPSYNETQVRREFVDPFLRALGWDVDNEQGYAEAYKDVVHEDSIKIGGSTKAPDYAVRVGGVRKFFVEAKKPSVNIAEDIGPAYQLRRYAWSAKLPLSILTDFEELAVYDCRIRPKSTDRASKARTLYVGFEQYEERWDEIASIFARDAILKGSFDKYAESAKKKRGTAAVDEEFLKEIEHWRDLLARNLALRNSKLSHREMNFAVQKTIDRIIFLRICEDRGIEPYGQLQSLSEGPKVYPRLRELFSRADDRYNSGLFHFTSEKNRIEEPDELTPSLQIDDKTLREIIGKLYYPDSPYEFSVLGADILGQVYEQFLGKVIRLTKGHRARIEEKPEVKKAGGVYYTPTPIVDYIVGETVGRIVDGQEPNEVGGRTKKAWKRAKGMHPLAIVDPACGSGSFLIGAYQCLLDWYRDSFVSEGTAKHKNRVYQTETGEWRLTTAERKRILLDHIYGVDIDPQAVEVTKLSLLLKVLEGESKDSLQRQMELFHTRALPDLAENIKCGNSLIGPDVFDSEQLALIDIEERLRINSFDWAAGFSDITKRGGFDAVIGNPPWGAALEQHDKDYFASKYQCFFGNHDTYLFFVEAACRIAADGALVSFVTPDSWVRVPQSQRLRELVLDATAVKMVTTLPQKVFPRVSANCIVFVLAKKATQERCKIRILLPESRLSLLSTQEFDDVYEVGVDRWKSKGDKQFQIYQTEEAADLVEKIIDQSIPAVNLLDVMQGIVPYSKENHSAEVLRDRAFHASERVSDEYGPWIRGRGLTRYGVDFESNEYLMYGEWLHRPRQPKYFNDRRILIQEITGGRPPRICACLCDERLYHDPGIISCLGNGQADLRHLLAIVNSRLMSWYHRYSSPKGFRHTFPKVLIGDIRAFPIRAVGEGDDEAQRHVEKLVALVDSMHELRTALRTTATAHERNVLERQVELTDKRIDRLVYDLYGLSDEEVSLIESEAEKEAE